MSCLLLLGAGFSRNWGGWLAAEAFEYLLGCPEIVASPALTHLLWKSQHRGGFEDALAELQVAVRFEPERAIELQTLQGAVRSMFNEMNNKFSTPLALGHNNALRDVLIKSDAIFTLNQDLFFEYQYLPTQPELQSRGRFSGVEIPGMQRATPGNEWHTTWTPKPENQFAIVGGTQPYIKLHGSINWQLDHSGGNMLIMGGNKTREIDYVPVLAWYQQVFHDALSQGGTRLMVIGYGFRDEHINRVIIDAVDNHGLKLFIVSPDGADQARKINPTYGAAIFEKSELEEVFERGLIGASRRALSETFGHADSIERAKFDRFFA